MLAPLRKQLLPILCPRLAEVGIPVIWANHLLKLRYDLLRRCPLRFYGNHLHDEVMQVATLALFRTLDQLTAPEEEALADQAQESTDGPVRIEPVLSRMRKLVKEQQTDPSDENARRVFRYIRNRMSKAADTHIHKFGHRLLISKRTHERRTAQNAQRTDFHYGTDADPTPQFQFEPRLHLTADQHRRIDRFLQSQAEATEGAPEWEALPDDDAASADPEFTYSRLEGRDMILQFPAALRGLTQLQRETVVRHFGLLPHLPPESLAEIARAQGIAIQSVHDTLSAAMRKLAVYFQITPLKHRRRPARALTPKART